MAQLVLSVIQSSANVDLTAIGPIDWGSWADNPASLTASDYKSGGGQTISVALVGGGAQQRYNPDVRTVSWTDGTINAIDSNTVGMYNDAATVGSGFDVTAPADTSVKIARFLVGAYTCIARVTASISDASTGAQVDSTTLDAPDTIFVPGLVTVTYAAAAPAQTMTMRIEVLTPSGGGPNVAFMAAGLAAGAAVAPMLYTRRTYFVDQSIIQI